MTLTTSKLFEQILGLCDVRWYFRMNSGNVRAAEDLATRSFDPMKVHFRRERQVAAGQREVKRSGQSITRIDHKGRKEDRITDNEATQFVTDYETVVDEHYMEPRTQQKEYERDLANNDVGQRHVADETGVRRERVKLKGDPWPLSEMFLPTWEMTLGEKRTREAIERIRSRPIYRTPSQPEPRKKKHALDGGSAISG